MYFFDILPPRDQRRVMSLVKSNDKGKSELSRYLSTLKPGEQTGYMAMFDTFLEAGVELFTKENFHPIDGPLGLWQFIKGRHRIVCFFDEDKTLVICTHGFLKRSKESPQEEIDRALKLREKYLSAKAKNELIHIP